MLKNILRASVWTLLLQSVSRVIGLVSTVILARILTPDDYGIVAVSMIVITFSAHLSSAGTGMYLIKLKDITLLDIQSGFTFLLISRLCTTVLIFNFSSEMASFFNDKRLIQVFQLIAFIPLIETFRNMEVVLEERRLSYKKLFLIGLHRKVLSFCVAISLAIYGFEYMSLIYAEVFGVIYYVIVSYFILPINHQHYFIKMNWLDKQAVFSFWSFLQTLVGFTKAKVDSILIARSLGVSDLGVYQLGHTISSIPTEQVATPVSAPIYAALSKFENGSKEQSNIFFTSLTTLSMLVYFLSGLLSSVAYEVTIILLGSKWLSVVPFISFLSFSYAIGSANIVLSRLFIAQNKIKFLLFYDLLSIVIVIILLASALVSGELIKVVEIRVLMFLCLLGLMMVFASLFCQLNILRMIRSILPSAVISFSSFYVTILFFDAVKDELFLAIMFKGGGFILIYTSMLFLWSFMLRFKNPESIVILSFLREIKFIESYMTKKGW